MPAQTSSNFSVFSPFIRQCRPYAGFVQSSHSFLSSLPPLLRLYTHNGSHKTCKSRRKTWHTGEWVMASSFRLAGAEITLNYRSWHACKWPSLGQALLPVFSLRVHSGHLLRLLCFLHLYAGVKKLSIKLWSLCLHVLVSSSYSR